FMLLSVPILVVTGTLITDKYIEPKFAHKMTTNHADSEPSFEITTKQKSALKWAGATSLVFIALLLAALLPADSPLRNAD
ncbi:AbgT family transporter, partial [Escherichia coli]|nr:AbgT family transporter [Escherichia coli]